jgi:hypothetical protein
MLPTPPGKHWHLHRARLQECTWHLDLLQRAARFRPQLSAVIGGKIG